MSLVDRRREPTQVGAPLSHHKKWRAITFATLAFVPAYWGIVMGAVAAATDGGPEPSAGPMIAFGLCLIPFVFIVLAFASEHPRAPRAVLRAMGLTLLVGIPVSAVAADAVTGLVAGMGAGGVAALRMDLVHDWKTRAWAVAIVTVYTYLLLRTAPPAALLLGPVLTFAGLGVADHLSERRAARAASGG